MFFDFFTTSSIIFYYIVIFLYSFWFKQPSSYQISSNRPTIKFLATVQLSNMKWYEGDCKKTVMWHLDIIYDCDTYWEWSIDGEDGWWWSYDGGGEIYQITILYTTNQKRSGTLKIELCLISKSKVWSCADSMMRSHSQCDYFANIFVWVYEICSTCFVFETWCEHRFLRGGLWWRWRVVSTDYSWSTDADDDADHQVAVDDSWEINAALLWSRDECP